MENLREYLLKGHVVPAQPLALDSGRKMSERHQRALTRYYVDAGSGGLAVGVHSTQFEIREPQYNLFEPVLRLASETIDEVLAKAPRPFVKIAGVCGRTDQAEREAALAVSLGYHAALLSMTAWKDAPLEETLEHCRRIGKIIPLVGFYLQPAVGGRVFPFSFWREFVEIPEVVAIKMAPFNRYNTLDVVRALAESGRRDIALYTGNDDNIIVDLLTPFAFSEESYGDPVWIAGGLLGQWGVGTRRAVRLLEEIKRVRSEGGGLDFKWLTLASALTDYNAAVFDVANGFAGCIPGIHSILADHGLMPGTWCLNPDETLSPGQAAELDRVRKAYPEFNDDDFIAANRERWLAEG